MPLDTVYLFSRWMHFTLLFVYSGCCFYSTLLAPRCWRKQLSRRLLSLSVLAAAGCLFSAWLLLAAQVGLMGDGWQDIMRSGVWQAVLATSFGRMWRLQLWLPLISLAALFIPRQFGRNLALLSALTQLCGLALVGHAAMHEGMPGVLQRINQSIHLISAAFWVGGLVPLPAVMLAARRQSSGYDAIRTMMRFSSYGHLAVVLVLVTGIIDGWLLLGWPPQSFQFYSQLLLFKVILVLLMIAIALFNRYWLVPRFRLAGYQAQRRFIAATCLELLLAAGVLILVAVFATLSPG